MVARLELRDAGTDGLDDAGALVAENGGVGHGGGAVEVVEVAAADATGGGLDEHLAFDRLVDLDVFDGDRLADVVEDHCSHGGSPPC